MQLDNGIANVILPTISKLGVALLAIVGIVFLIRLSRDAIWVKQDTAGLRFIVEHSLATVLVSLVPYPIYSMTNSEETSWRASSFVLFMFYLYQIGLFVRTLYHSIIPRRFEVLICLWLIPAIGMAALLLLNSLWGKEANIFYFGLLFLIFFIGCQFIHFLEISRSLFEKS